MLCVESAPVSGDGMSVAVSVSTSNPEAPRASEEDQMIDRILIATDFSDCAREALEFGLALACKHRQKYKAKAAIDMIVDRAAKAVAALVLVFVIARSGLSTRITLLIALASIGTWLFAAILLGKLYVKTVGARSKRDTPVDSSEPTAPHQNDARGGLT